MSTRWDVRCLDCNCDSGLIDGGQDAVRSFIQHRHTLAALYPLLNEVDALELRSFYGSLDTSWYQAHHEHRLVPVNQYGHVLDLACSCCRATEETRLLHLGSTRLGYYCESCAHRAARAVAIALNDSLGRGELPP